MQVEYARTANFLDAKRTTITATTAATDFTSVHDLADLIPHTEYFYRGIVTREAAAGQPTQGATGRFRTAPARSQSFKFAVSGDMRADHQPFRLFDRIVEKKPDFFVLLGDTIYADVPRSDFFPSLDFYRAKHRENRSDKHLQAFLKKIPVYAIWDDHEVDNDFNKSFGALIEQGRTAFREYWPIRSTDETVLYRKFSWTPLADFFVLDTRQCRSVETDPDGSKPTATMLGARQKDWLKKALSESRAPFKFVFTSVPFNFRKSLDKWSGFVTERQEITDHIAKNGITGVVMISADMHWSADNTRHGRREYAVGPIAVAPNCGGKRFFAQSGLFYMCDSSAYLLVETASVGGKPTAKIQFLDDQNKVRFEDSFTANISYP